MLVARIGRFEGMGPGVNLHNQIDDIFQLHVMMRGPKATL